MTKPITSKVVIVVGAQWGDEGKGKIVDFLSSDADIVMRANGGDNAGHTVVNSKGKFALHLLPAGIFNPKAINIISAGVVLNPLTLISEIELLKKQGISKFNLNISKKTHLIFDYHKSIDALQEEMRGKSKIGTTKKGVGPAYMDKAERIGLTAGLLKDRKRFFEKLKYVLKTKERYFDKQIPIEFKSAYYKTVFDKANEFLAKYITDTEEIVQKYIKNGSKIVVEGAHGALLDIDHGTYPNVTSSNTIAPGLLLDCGIAPKQASSVVGVYKAYQTRVGQGGMPTELFDNAADLIREKGHEYGTTTGRPRRVGYFDAVAARYVNELNGFTDVGLTRLDTLSGVKKLKICTKYKLNGKIIDRFPSDDSILINCDPIYEEYEGWGDITKCKKFSDLPKSAQIYCQAIMKNLEGAKLSYIGIGESRKDLIIL